MHQRRITAILMLGAVSFSLLFLLRSGEDMEALEGLLRSEAGCPQFSEGAPLISERRQRHWATRYSNEAVYQRMRTSKCEMGQHEEHQKAVPLAFSFVVHHGIGVLETSLRLLYRPHHSFCIAVDARATSIVQSAVKELVQCYRKKFGLKNIVIAEHPEPIYWGDISLLNADLRCLRHQLSASERWKYHLNLAGSELPNFAVVEMETKLEKELRGGNSVMTKLNEDINYRYKYKYKMTKEHLNAPTLMNQTKEDPPYGLKVFKGLKNVVLNRTMAEFMTEHPVAKSFLRWCKDMLIPDESFYATLIRVSVNNDLDLPVVHQDVTRPASHYFPVCTRYTDWENNGANCHGMFKREICNLSVFDLVRVRTSPNNCLFVNKFDMTVDPLAAPCWEEMVRAGAEGRRDLFNRQE